MKTVAPSPQTAVFYVGPGQLGPKRDPADPTTIVSIIPCGNNVGDPVREWYATLEIPVGGATASNREHEHSIFEAKPGVMPQVVIEDTSSCPVVAQNSTPTRPYDTSANEPRISRRVTPSSSAPDRSDSFLKIIGNSPLMLELCEKLSRLLRFENRSGTRLPNVLILGETGTGKGVVAEALKEHGPRRDKPFVIVNCATLPSQLIESELFGHKKGAFTSAQSNRPGLFMAANTGTIFLDEIGEMPPDMQAKILRVVETSSVKAVGSDEEVPVDVQIIAATHKELNDRSTFRGDLFYRLSEYSFSLPPLRERANDVPKLVEHFVAEFCEENSLSPKSVQEEALRFLERYEWPGNIRQLKQVLRRACIDAFGDKVITPWHLDDAIVRFSAPGTEECAVNVQTSSVTLNQAERQAIEQALTNCRGNVSRAASQLNVQRSTLCRKMKALNLKAVDYKQRRVASSQ